LSKVGEETFFSSILLLPTTSWRVTTPLLFHMQLFFFLQFDFLSTFLHLLIFFPYLLTFSFTFLLFLLPFCFHFSYYIYVLYFAIIILLFWHYFLIKINHTNSFCIVVTIPFCFLFSGWTCFWTQINISECYFFNLIMCNLTTM
jgi:hypothetical protein